MFDAARAVLHSLTETGLSLPEPILFINDMNKAMAADYLGAQFWTPELEETPLAAKYKSVVIFTPKQKEETRALIARGLQMLEHGGVLVASASNEAGGKTLTKMMVEFGVKVQDHSKHKCRVAWTTEPQKAAAVMIQDALKRGGLQQRNDGLWSMPGLFSWDRLDKGTDVLLHHLPFALNGHGADFGCGIGVIGHKLLSRYKDIKKLVCIDRDTRALEATKKNLEPWKDRIEMMQADLSKHINLSKMDFIIMNPPFHIGKKQAASVGQAFILNAAQNLKKEGILVFVANTHLPYEKVVAENFSFHRILSEEHGFKIIEAIK